MQEVLKVSLESRLVLFLAQCLRVLGTAAATFHLCVVAAVGNLFYFVHVLHPAGFLQRWRLCVESMDYWLLIISGRRYEVFFQTLVNLWQVFLVGILHLGQFKQALHSLTSLTRQDFYIGGLCGSINTTIIDYWSYFIWRVMTYHLWFPFKILLIFASILYIHF